MQAIECKATARKTPRALQISQLFRARFKTLANRDMTRHVTRYVMRHTS